MTVDELQVLITANTTALQKEIAKTNSTIASLKKSADKTQGGVTSAFKKLKTGIVALGIGKVIKDSGFTIASSVPADAKFTDTTYENATSSKAGLMSSSDKSKLDGIKSTPSLCCKIIFSLSMKLTTPMIYVIINLF